MNDDRHLQRGLLLYEQENFSAAEDELRQSLHEDPGNPFAHSILALCLSRREAYDDATEQARMAIVNGPDVGLSHFALASVLEDRNRYDEAIDSIQRAIELDPQSTTFLALYAALLLHKRKWEQALSVANRGLAVDAEDQGCGNIRAAALVQLGRHDEANHTIDGMLEKGPTNAYSHANLGWSALHQGNHREAAEHFREALRLDPNLEWARRGMLECLKARNFVYRLLLRFFLFMSTLSREGQWGVILGLWVASQVVRRVGNAQPEWKPVLMPLLYAYIAFAALTWIGTPLFNLLLRLDRFGRFVLSDEEKRESTIFGFAVLAVIVFGVLAGVYGGIWIIAVFVSGLLLLPLTATFRCDKGWPRLAMVAYTLALFLAGCGILFNASLIPIFLIGCILSSIVGNVLASVTPKK